MSGERRLNSDMRGFGVAHLADHDHVRILPQKSAQRARERQTDGRFDLTLVDAVDFVFDRVFNRQNFACIVVEDTEGRGQRGSLATASGAGHDNHSVRRFQRLVEGIEVALQRGRCC